MTPRGTRGNGPASTPGPGGFPAPLSGVTVVSLEQAVAAPFATRQLADLGARVIKVERTGSGDFARGYDETVNGMSSYFAWLNRGFEYTLLWGLVCFAIALRGGGPYSADRKLGVEL